MNVIRRFNDWYDHLSGGRRFGLFLLMILAGPLGLELAMTLQRPGLALISGTIFLTMVVLAIFRAWGHTLASKVTSLSIMALWVLLILGYFTSTS